MGRAILLAAAAALLLADDVRAATAPTVRAPALAPASVGAGSATTAKVSLTNRSRKQASYRVELHLSKDAKLNRGDVRLARKSLRIKARKKATTSVKLTVPRNTAPGSYRVLACVKKLCKASRALTVKAAGAAGGGPGGGPLGAGGAPAGSPAPGNDATFTPSGPFKPTLDGGRAASATITPAGGTLEATAADGSRFRLTIPADALLSDQEITMTPLSSADGLPYRDGLVAGVQFGPDGLQLLKPGTLEITPAQPVPLDRQSPFAWNGSDDDLHNEPLDPDPSKIVMAINHFSGAGLAGGSYEDRLRQAEQLLEDQSADFRNKAARELNESRANGTPIPYERLAELMREYHTDIVKPDLTAAVTDDNKFLLAFREVLEFERTAVAIAVDDRLGPQFAFNGSRMDDALLNYYNRAYDRCVTDNNPEAGFEMFRALEIYAKAWLWDSVRLTEPKISKCHRYELDVSGTIEARNTDPFTGYRQSVSAEATGALMTLGPYGERDIRTFKSLTITDASWEDDNEANECTHDWTGQGTAGGPVYLNGFRININLIGSASPEVPEMRVDLNTGQRKPKFLTTCTDPDGHVTQYDSENPAWDFGWLFGHQDEFYNTVVADWGWRTHHWARVGQGGVWAHKVYKRTVQVDDVQSYTEDVRLVLRHVPQP